MRVGFWAGLGGGAHGPSGWLDIAGWSCRIDLHTSHVRLVWGISPMGGGRGEEDKHGRKVDVPYIGIVKSCDPREGLCVQFDSYEDQEMLITNEDDWRWGSHSGGRKPPESRFTR